MNGEDAAKLVLAILTIVGAMASHVATKDYYVEKVETLSASAARFEVRAKAADASLAEVRRKLEESTVALGLLEEKYARCTRIDGRVIQLPYSGASMESHVLATGDSLGIPLAGSSLRVVLRRVARNGAVIGVENCAQLQVKSGVESPEDSGRAFALGEKYGLVIWVSTSCCELGLHSCNMDDLEEISIWLDSFRSEDQIATLRTSRQTIFE